ncbi:Crp/Fnr family transcriptional regulator [Membranihabitans marinus]
MEEMESLKSLYHREEVKKGDFLLREGGHCHHTFFVESGLIRMYAIDGQGKEHIVQFACENWLLSDRSSAYFDESSDYFIDAIEDSVVVMLDKGFVDGIIEVNPSFQRINERLLHNHIRHLQKRIHGLMAETAEERYLEFINLYPDLTLRVPQWMMASYLGVTPESLSRVRRDLAKRNFKSY